MSAIDTIPSGGEMATSETLPWSFDFGPLMLQGETLSSPTVKILDEQSELVVANSYSNVTVVGTQVSVTILGSALTAGKRYDVLVTAQAAVLKVWTLRLSLWVPE